MAVLAYASSRMIGVNDLNQPLGEDHHRARLSNAQVDEIRDLADAGWSQRRLATKFGVSRGTIGDIVRFRRRASYATGWRRVANARACAEV